MLYTKHFLRGLEEISKSFLLTSNIFQYSPKKKNLEKRKKNELHPARSLHLNPLNFFLWGALKNVVYQHETVTNSNTS